MLSVTHKHTDFHKRQITTFDFDYYNRYLVTGGADSLIQIRDTEKHSEVELREHAGPVLGVSFSHPEFGFLASCGADSKLVLYKTDKSDKWTVVYLYNSHKAPTTSVDWAPQRAGAVVACASADGTISIHSLNDISKAWCVSLIANAHATKGVNAVSWSQQMDKGHLLLASGGNDNKLKIWRDQPCCTWALVHETDNQLDAIKDVSWCPTPGLQKHMIASCADGGRVVVWMTENFVEWDVAVIDDPDEDKYHINFSRVGNLLAISHANYVVKIWKQHSYKIWMYLDRKVGMIHPVTPTEPKPNNVDLFSVFV